MLCLWPGLRSSAGGDRRVAAQNEAQQARALSALKTNLPSVILSTALPLPLLPSQSGRLRNQYCAWALDYQLLIHQASGRQECEGHGPTLDVWVELDLRLSARPGFASIPGTAEADSGSAA